MKPNPKSEKSRLNIWKSGWGLGGLLALLLLPLGYLYLRGAFRSSIDYNITNVPGLEDERFPLAVMGLSNSLEATGQMTGFWSGADDIYAARLNAIRQAQRSIRFETYYMTPGYRADQFAAALIERAQAGVDIHLLVDDQGTSSLSDEYWESLQATGIEVRFFREFNWRAPLEYNSRTHRKLLLIDGQQVLIGGAGISDEWDGDPEEGDRLPWLEFEVSYEGPVVNFLEGKFLQNWAYEGGTIDLEQYRMEPQPEEDLPLYITDDTSTLNESKMRMLFQVSFLAANDRIWISSPYFVPDSNTRAALIEARDQGVDVRVLTMSEQNNKPFVRYAARELYGDLVSAGVQICEYQPSMMHAKAVLIDQGWASTGSANFDPRSYFHNDELNISTSHPQLVENLERFFDNALAESDCLTEPQWQARPWSERIRGQLGLIFKNLM